MSLLGPPQRIDPETGARIRAWATELWDVPAGGSIAVSELRCTEPGCAPLETVVVVSARAGETFQRKVHKRAADVTLEDLQGAHP